MHLLSYTLCPQLTHSSEEDPLPLGAGSALAATPLSLAAWSDRWICPFGALVANMDSQQVRKVT